MSRAIFYTRNCSLYLPLLAAIACITPAMAAAQTASAPSRITSRVDQGQLVTLPGHTRTGLTPERDLGAVEDSKPLRLVLLLQRSPEQQAELDSLIARQQQQGAPEFHKWLTPKEYGAKFGVATPDIQTVTLWLQSQGFEVKSVLNNGTMIDFATTAGGVRNTFKTELHYWNFAEGKQMANTSDPQIPAALATVVAGIKGLSPVPARPAHTPIHPIQYDAETHNWHNVTAPSKDGIQPAYLDPNGNYVETPQDLYTIYNVNPILKGGNLGKGVTVAIPEPSDINFGTVDSTGHASGGVVANFRKNFGVAGTLNFVVMHGAGTVTCGDPGQVAGFETEASLDADWANALAPSAELLLMSCDNTGAAGDGLTTAEMALVDNNLSDVISVSYDGPETTSSDYSFDDQLYTQAASQGQTIIVAGGDSGSDTADQNTGMPAVSGYNVSRLASSPLVTAAGGTDFSDLYDQHQGGPPQSTYWSSTNSPFYGDALGYIPETVWNASCASSIIAKDVANTTPAGYCASKPSEINAPVGGGGGVSIHYAQPSYQAGTPGLSGSIKMRAYPDVSLFAANGYWGHFLVTCDSADPCTSPSTFGGGGGTSFVTPQIAGITALLINATGSRQGLLNPTLYALGKAQLTNSATATACYSNGQTNNTGVTTGLPAASCIFHDVTTSNNDVGCLAGSLDCYTQSGAPGGVLSLNGAASLAIPYPAGAGYDEATGLGTLNVANLINNWSTAFTSSTSLTANPTSITTAQSTTLTATVKGGTPNGSTGAAPALKGTVTFKDGSVVLGSCTVAGSSCSIVVAGSSLQVGSNSILAVFTGSGTYPSSTSNVVNVTVAAAQPTPAATPTFSPAGGSYSSTQSVTISDATSGSTIYYTTDGSAPTTSSNPYTGPITVTATETINAIATASGFANSATASATYTISGGGSTPPAINYSSGFTASGLSLQGGATVGNGVLQLTDAARTYEGRSAFFRTPVNVQSFTTDFTFQATSATAEGFTFTLQNAPAGAAALGQYGYFLGYGGSNAIAKSVAVKFDLYNNSGEGANSTGIYTNGATPEKPSIDLTPSGVNLHSGDVMHAHFTYDGDTLILTLTDTVTNATFTTSMPVNIPAIVGSSTAYVGFTGGTSAATAIQNIQTWTYTVGMQPMQTAIPTFSPVAGTYSGPQVVTISDATPGATIFFTTDGSPATTSSTPYTAPLNVKFSETINALAIASGSSTGMNASASYTIGSTTTPTINYSSGFAPAGLSLQGGAAVSNGSLHITDANSYEARSAFFRTPVNVQSFTTDFTFQATSASAEGFTFTLQNAPAGAAALGGLGYNLGYGGSNGIASSVAVKFDLFSNSGEGANSTGFFTNGATPEKPSIDLTPSGVNLHSGHVMQAHLTYDGTTLTLTLTDTVTNATFTTAKAINIPSVVGSSTAYAGFTGGTSAATAIQNLLTWTYGTN